MCLLCYLYFPQQPSGFHPTGHIHTVSPDVILRLLGPNYSCNYWPMVYADPQSEVIKRVLVDDIQLPNESKCKLHHCANVHVLSVVFLCTLWSWRHIESSRSHVGRTDGLNLLHSAEFWLGQQLRAQEEKSPLHYIYKKQEIAVAFSQTLAFSSAFPATLEHNNQV